MINDADIRIQNSNIVELYSKIIKDDDQLTYYNSGVGTYATHGILSHTRWVSNILDQAIAL